MRDALSTHYAEALASTVFAAGSDLEPAEASRQLKAASDLLLESKDLQGALLSPAVTRAHKQAIVGKVADALGLHRLIKNFFLVVVSHRRTRELPLMQQNFDLIVDERSGWIPAAIESAHELSPEQRDSIEKALGAQLGKFIRAHYKVDRLLIGGIRAHIASKEYDATVRGKLEGMRARLLPQS